ncbi:MAG: amidohydrolase [Candidatus Bathyarchaeota archaeon]|nr:amidohydrolase [Candidatus Bathyarchaeota archaeon]
MKADVVIRNCIIVTMNMTADIIKQGVIAIKDGLITYVGRSSEAPILEADIYIDGSRKIAMPGLINCHTHAAMSLFRGVAEDKEITSWLRETIWPLESKLRPEDVYYGSLLSCVEMIKSGTTCFSDMYFHEDMVAKAIEETGMRCVLSPGIIDSIGGLFGEVLLTGALKIARKYGGGTNNRIYVMLGPHAVYSCSPKLLRRIGEKASELNIGIHIHLAESEGESASIRETYGRSEVELLSELGLLRPNLLAAHCIHLSDTDIMLMAKHDVKAVYNPVSNMKLSSGIPRIKDLLDAGVTVGLGTDGPASNNILDMFDTMKIAALLQKARYGDPRVLPARKVVEMATRDGARALGLSGLIGSIEVGKRADIILIDINKPHLTPLHDIYAALVYSARGSDVSTVIIDGKIVMDERRILSVDENEVVERAEKTAYDLLSRKDPIRDLVWKA